MIMDKYLDYILEQMKTLLAIDSPSGYTQKVTDYLMAEYQRLGYHPLKTVKGGVLTDWKAVMPGRVFSWRHTWTLLELWFQRSRETGG